MLLLSLAFAFLSLMLGRSFYLKYQTRLRLQSQNTMRYNRIADYYGRPILLTFDYSFGAAEAPTKVEADVDEIYHYGNDYFLKGRSPDRKRPRIYKWNRISNPRVRVDGGNLESLEQLFTIGEGYGSRAVA